MHNLIEPVRIITSVVAVATAFATWEALRRPRAAVLWFVVAAGAGAYFSHVVAHVPVPQIVPVGGVVGLLVAIAAVRSPRLIALFEAFDDRRWRTLMMPRAIFGSLILAAGALELLPLDFALPAGIGDIVVGALALVVPGSIAAGGDRVSRLLVFGVGIIDFASVITLQITVLVPWLATTSSLGISLLLPWVAVPALAAVNVAGTRLLLRDVVTRLRAAAIA